MQRETVHVLVHTDVGEYMLDNAQLPGIDALSLWTEVDIFARIENEVSSGEGTRLGLWSLHAVDTIHKMFLLGKARIAFAELVVGDLDVDLFIPAQR